MFRYLIFALSCSLIGFSFAQYAYIEDPQLFSENVLPPHAHFIFDTQDDVRHITQNPNYLMLNGEWLFHHSLTPEKRPVDFYREDFDTVGWHNIAVPSNWQLNGYDYPIYTNWKYPFNPDKPNVPRDFNPVGSYKKTFSLPKDWTPAKDEIMLHFGGVNSCFFVWVNGQYLGYSEDSKLPTAFLASPHLKAGENQIAVEVYKYCDATYLEDQDMWRLAGIERDVYLYKRPALNLGDFKVACDYNSANQTGSISLEMYTHGLTYPQSSYVVKAQLLDRDGTIVWQRRAEKAFTPNSWSYTSFIGEIQNVTYWSAQHPYLYTLHIDILDEADHMIQAVEQKVGFRSLEIKEGVFFINGDTALIKGVNRHEHDAKWGHAVGYTGNVFNEDSLRKDLLAIKALNFNAVRTAHYPNHPMFYDLCDELGLYVCDEANVEGHYYMMFAPFDNLAIDPEYKDAVLDRIFNMYQRDKNHPSIIMWSVGNETGTGKTMVEAYNMLKELDNRPVFNERHFFLNTIKEKHSDFNGHMYAPMDKVKKLVDKDHDKPFIWIEYAHAMGNSSGNFSDLWDFIRSEPRVQGGFVWDWRDQGIWKANEQGERFLAYGGHFEPDDHPYVGGLQGDGNFCANGVIAADGKLHPGAYAIKNAQSPVQIEMVDYHTYKFINDFETENLKDYTCIMSWRTASGEEYVQTYHALTCEPLSDTIIHLALDSNAAVVTFSIEKDEFSYKKNFFLRRMQLPVWAPTKTESKFDWVANEKGYEIRNERLSFDLSDQGRISNFYVDGKLKCIEGPRVNFWRALTDNDYGNKANKRLAYWRTAVQESELIELSYEPIGNYLVIHSAFELPQKKGYYSVDYTIYPDGLMKVKFDFSLKNSDEIPRIGSYMILPEDYSNLQYLGMGPYENYIDRYDGQWFDDHAFAIRTVDGEENLFVQKMPYIRPQEYGNRTSTYSLQLQALEDTIQIRGTGFSFSAWPHSLSDIDEGDVKTGKTALDVPTRNYTWLNIDFGQTGVGGDNSWGRKPYDKYILKEGEYRLEYVVKW
jgi:beta-galactosidase